MDLKKYTEANREAWNEAVVIHRRGSKINLSEEFKKPGYSTLDGIITEKLRKIGLENNTVCQICCNNGRELLSLISLGAKDGVGFDISDEAIEEANQLRDISGLNCEFIRTDVYDIGGEYKNKFDLVYMSIGALCWLPDLKKLFEIVSRLLKNPGILVIYELHSITSTLAIPSEKEYDTHDPLKIRYPYFRSEPIISNDGFDYVGKTTYKAKTSYDFVHTLGYIISSIAKSGLVIEDFTEYPHDISGLFEHLEPDCKLPLSYIIVGRKAK